MPRRLFTALCAAPLLAACAPTPGTPSPRATNTPGTEAPGRCVELSGFDFAPPPLCGSDPPIDFTLTPQPYRALRVRAEGIAAAYQNALVRWRPDGSVEGLLGTAATVMPAFDWRGVAASQRCDGVIDVWRDGCVIGEVNAHSRTGDPHYQELGGGVVGLVLAPDGAQVYSLGGDGRLASSHTDGGLTAEVTVAADDDLRGLGISGDGTRLAIWRAGGAVALFDAPGLKQAGEVEVADLTAVSFGAGSRWFAITGGHTVATYDGTSLVEETPVPTRYASALAVGPEDTVAVAGNEGLWLLRSGAEPRLLTEAGGFAEVAFAPDGGLLYALEGTDGIVGFDTGTGEQAVTMAAPGEAA